jgi:hypothetical protein
MHETYFKKLCDDLRDSEREEDIRHAAAALRRYMQDQQFILRRRLLPYVEKAFLTTLEEREPS